MRLIHLVVEIVAFSLSDDLGVKRMLYERAEIREYHVIYLKEKKARAYRKAAQAVAQIVVQ